MKPIYKPKGKAAEYGDYAINIYTGCPHRCYYCFAPNVLHTKKEQFHSCVEPRKNIIEETRNQITREGITDKLIHLCFTCDPYPKGKDSSTTREIIKILKETGNHVQILTKNGEDALRDFDLLDENDWFGITLDGTDSNSFVSSEAERIWSIMEAYKRGINTWISFEPVVNAERVLDLISENAMFVNKIKIGKLNYHYSDIDWKLFGKTAETVCMIHNINYYIKDSLRAEMVKEK